MKSLSDRLLQVAMSGVVFPNDPHVIAEAQAEIDRLKAAKRRALAIADERGKENVRLRAAAKDAVLKVNGMWAAGDPPHMVKQAADALDKLQSIAFEKD